MFIAVLFIIAKIGNQPKCSSDERICFSHVQFFVTPWNVACQAPLSMEFFRQEYWLLFLVQSLSCVQLFVIPWIAAHPTSLSFTISWSCSNSCPLSWWCHPTISSSVTASPPTFNLSQDQGRRSPWSWEKVSWFSKESVLHIRWPKYWSISFSICPSRENSGLISFRIDWFDLAVQETLKSLLQHRSSKTSILRCSGFF